MGKVDPENDKDRKLSHKFAQMYLRQDGVFVLKLVAKNSTNLVVADIIAALWDNYKSKPMFASRSTEDKTSTTSRDHDVTHDNSLLLYLYCIVLYKDF